MARIPRPPRDPQLIKALERFWRSDPGRYARQAALRFREFVGFTPSSEEAKAAAEAARKAFAEEEVPATTIAREVPASSELSTEYGSKILRADQLQALIKHLLDEKEKQPSHARWN